MSSHLWHNLTLETTRYKWNNRKFNPKIFLTLILLGLHRRITFTFALRFQVISGNCYKNGTRYFLKSFLSSWASLIKHLKSFDDLVTFPSFWYQKQLEKSSLLGPQLLVPATAWWKKSIIVSWSWSFSRLKYKRNAIGFE